MEFYEKIGTEIAGDFAELEVAEFETADTPNSILIQGTWPTSNGVFLLEYEWLAKAGKIFWLRVSEFDTGNKAVAEFNDLAVFQKHYPECSKELIEFAREIKH